MCLCCWTCWQVLWKIESPFHSPLFPVHIRPAYISRYCRKNGREFCCWSLWLHLYTPGLYSSRYCVGNSMHGRHREEKGWDICFRKFRSYALSMLLPRPSVWAWWVWELIGWIFFLVFFLHEELLVKFSLPFHTPLRLQVSFRHWGRYLLRLDKREKYQCCISLTVPRPSWRRLFLMLLIFWPEGNKHIQPFVS